MMAKLCGSKNESYNEKVDEFNDLCERMDNFKKRNFIYRFFFYGRYQSMKIHLATICVPDYWEE